MMLAAACGETDGKENSATNGVTNGTTNGATNGASNGATNGETNGANSDLEQLYVVMIQSTTSAPDACFVTDQLLFGVNVEGLAPGEQAVIDAGVFGYPLKSISDIPEGEYWVQGLLHIYETFQRSDGHVVKMPMDRGEGQQWNRAPGNIYSTPQKMRIDPAKDQLIAVVLDQKIAPIPDPPETKYIKHVKIQSKLLTEFWGRPMHLGAHILLPEGFEEHPEARYPLAVFHGHFPYTFDGFRESPPDPDLEPEYSDRFDWPGYNKTVQEYAYEFYKWWTAPDTPRVLVILIQHANPFYDDSYAVNSDNVGPYGDAITYELIPHIEKKFRGIGEGWARFLYGGSTGGWEALGVQVFYPDEYNGCYAACPDPIDFRAYTVVNIYENDNAYYLKSLFKRTPRPGHRDYLGHISSTLEDMNHILVQEHFVSSEVPGLDEFLATNCERVAEATGPGGGGGGLGYEIYSRTDRRGGGR